MFTGNRNTAGRAMTLRLTNYGTVTAEGAAIERIRKEKTTVKVN